jgi:hypothetical protein
MSKYVAPRLRKDQTDQEKNAKLNEMLRDASVADFPVLGGGAQFTPKPKLEYAAKAVEWEQKRLEIEEKKRVDEYVKKIQEEKARDDQIMMDLMPNFGVKRPTNYHHVVDEPPPPPVPVDEWVRVERKPRKEKKELNFEEEDDRIDFFEVQDHVASRLRKSNKS